MPKYTVESPLDHDGKRYEVGGSVTMEADQAKHLVDSGVLSTSKDKADPPPTPDPATVEQIVEAIGKLDKENKDHWMKSGAPQVKALEAVLDNLTVSAADRDAAWANYQEANKGDGK